MADWVIILLTVLFAAALCAVVVVVAERFGRIWAPIWIIGFLIGMSILFDYGGAKQTEFALLGTTLLFAAGPMMWPVIALGQDYINEFYGPKLAYNYTLGMFLAKIGVALGTLWIIFVLPVPTSVPEQQDTANQFNDILGISPRLNIASIVAVIAAFLVNPWVYHRLRMLTSGRKLWLRQQVAAIVALTVDALIFFYGAFLGVLPLGVIWEITYSYLLLAFATVFIDTAFLYAMAYVKRNGLFGVSARTGEELVIRTVTHPAPEPKTARA